MLDKESSRSFNAYLLGEIRPNEFEDWLYSYPLLEEQLGVDLYLDLISIDFTVQSSKKQVKDLFGSQINYAAIHQEQILNTIGRLKAREGSPLELIAVLYKYAEMGYFFLADNDLVANFGEMGKSISSALHKLDEKQQWERIQTLHKSFLFWIAEIEQDIKQERIRFTGKSNIGFYGQEYFIWERAF
ncbi:MAG: hypothetical protein R2795_15070 [Saprospiraceae bacterium]